MAFLSSSIFHTRGSELGFMHLTRPFAAVGIRDRPVSSSTSGWRKISAGIHPLSRNLMSSSQAEDQKVEPKYEDVSFLEMWDRTSVKTESDEQKEWARRGEQFQSLLQVPREERDKAQRMQVVDRAAAALAAVNALLADFPSTGGVTEQHKPLISPVEPAAGSSAIPSDSSREIQDSESKPQSPSSSQPQKNSAVDGGLSSSASSGSRATPGPDFWSWVPPRADADGVLQPLKSSPSDVRSISQVLERDNSSSTLSLPFESDEMGKTPSLPLASQSRATPSLPPLQSLLEVGIDGRVEPDSRFMEDPSMKMPMESEAASGTNEELRSGGKPSGQNADGSRWWRESGVEYRDNSVVCNWTIIRGVSADEGTEWEEKFWEASDAFDYKELGAEKSGRDSTGKVWNEFWTEAMWQDVATGVQHMKRSANKWGKDGVGGEWREKWFEHYDAIGQTEKWADKWSQIDSNTALDAGHAHTWHERWGEKFDGQGSAMKYTDKWAERKELDGRWTKWGDKWDEHFDHQGHGVKQGETWWEGTSGERWNRTWGEGHHGTGWVHKYGKSSSGEHWDTHQLEDTWYERTPHFGFNECFENSRHLRSVQKRRERAV